MSAGTIIVRYALFAAMAMAANIAAQHAMLSLYSGPLSFWVALGAGVGTALCVKYPLDKKWIFYDTASGFEAHSRRFGLYSLGGVFTTLIFCAFEFGFWQVWATPLARDIGAVIGLAISYVVKYLLDRRFVFAAGTA